MMIHLVLHLGHLLPPCIPKSRIIFFTRKHFDQTSKTTNQARSAGTGTTF